MLASNGKDNAFDSCLFEKLCGETNLLFCKWSKTKLVDKCTKKREMLKRKVIIKEKQK